MPRDIKNNLSVKRTTVIKVLAKYFYELKQLPYNKFINTLPPDQRYELETAVQFLEDTQYAARSDGKPGMSGHTTALIFDGQIHLLEIENGQPRFINVSIDEYLNYRKIWNKEQQEYR